MQIKITFEESSTASFISWKRLAEELFKRSGELKSGERITHFDVGERGINYFVARTPIANGEGQ
ncbi:hypothetical protein [Bradyrhizobium sp. Tv2a-2]|uniref:hypothetical protein n=1 Tax=Bradyrhizobium sp. Tv2a-2 TaxID=113395 RepID=UPI0004006AD2|nr:hypothetical protein [Bradyrhizobium sp. Tv2a-2]